MTSKVQHRNHQSRRESILGIQRTAMALALALASAVVAIPSAQAQAYKILYTFTGGTDGGNPYAGLVRDTAGNLYGTTLYGGASGDGVVFKVSTTGTESVLLGFNETNGLEPVGGLILDTAGNLYGTTWGGGASYMGVVFKLDPTDKETVLYNFTGGTDGGFPYAGLILDAAGNLYGTTSGGGVSPGFLGVVFKVDKSGKETVLYSFTGGTDGGYPYAGLIRDTAGNLYGTTFQGGDLSACGGIGCGVVFKLDPTGKQTVLHSFTGADGSEPIGGVIRDSAGNLYGTTYEGGASNAGTVFKLDTAGAETVLHSFAGGTDGANPNAGLIQDAAGNLYGTTALGGMNSACPSGCGTVFRVSTTGVGTVLYRFTGDKGGAYPEGGLIPDTHGHLYGTTYAGGPSDAGVVFELTPGEADEDSPVEMSRGAYPARPVSSSSVRQY